MIEQSTKDYSLPIDDPATLVATLKDVLEQAFTRINRLEQMMSAAPTLVYSIVDAVEALPQFAPLRGRVGVGCILRTTQALCAPMISEYLATGKFPDFEAVKPKLALAAIDGVRVDGGEQGGAD